MHKDGFKGKPDTAFATADGGQPECIKSIEGIVEYFGVDMVNKSDILSAGARRAGRAGWGRSRKPGAPG